MKSCKRRRTYLQRRPSQDQPVFRSVILVERLTQFTLDVFHSVTLINDHVYPLDLAENRSFLDNVLVSRQADLEIDSSKASILISTL